jgi:hypothetical protein
MVAARNTWTVVMTSTMPAHDQRGPLITRSLGAHTAGGAGLHPRPRSPGGGAGGDGPVVTGAAGTELACFICRKASGGRIH